MVKGKYKKGMVMVELMVSLFIWTIFLTGVASLWFLLFSPNLPIYSYVDSEKFFAGMSGGLNGLVFPIRSTQYTDRNVSFVTGQGGLEMLSSDWKNSFGKRVCRGLETDKLKQIPFDTTVDLDDLNIASAAFIRGDYVYLTANSSSTTDPDFYIISIKDPKKPALISRIDTGPGLTSVTLAGYMSYVANTSVNSQAQAIDISEPAVPTIKWSFKVPGTHGTSTGLGKAVVSDGNRVYLGTAKSDSSELFSLDAVTGSRLAEYELGAGVNGLFLDHDRLYLASPVDPELFVFDVSVRSALRPSAQYDAQGGSGNGKSLEVFNDHIYLGRTLGGNELLSLSSPLASTSNDLQKRDEEKIGATIDSMLQSGNTLFILTAHSQKELQVWKIDSGTGKLTFKQAIDLPARAVALGCSRENLFVVLGTHTPLMIFAPDKT